MNAPLFFSNAGDERGTPTEFFAALDAEFHFDLDCAASVQNAKCPQFFGHGGLAEDALEQDWGGLVCFLNPPYSVAGAFVAKAREEANKGATVVQLLPVRSDTKWWHRWVYDVDTHTWRSGVAVRLLPGRLNFELNTTPDLRAWIKSEIADTLKVHAGRPTDTQNTYMDEKIKGLVDATGLPKMAILRINDDQPDDCLLDSAPFPSCVVIFTKESAE